MLFSNDEVAKLINESFEPTWESVRPVPIVRIDFGNGTVLTRTLNGNIATYVCTADGQTLDIAAGIYNAEGYAERLHQLLLLHDYVHQDGPEKMSARLKEYHAKQIEALKKDNEPLKLEFPGGGRGKMVIEFPLKVVLAPAAGKKPGGAKAEPAKDAPANIAKEDRVLFEALAEDTRINETTRRLQVSEMLAKTGPVKPSAVTKPLYKDILHADLDDPYLGLGETLFKNYPFSKEEKRK